ncbi:MAG TPA: hypothetical protein ENK56_00860 [Chloroflexi bacterium]|nr:hypothetical protein [Chloroflexota bacterium]
MAGLIGWVGQASREQVEQGLRRMAAAMPRRDALRADLYADEGIGLGRLHLGTLNPEPQPLWNEDRSLAIVMEGEVYDYADEKRRLMERGHRFPVGNDVEFVLHLFEEYGPEALPRLNGAFVAAIWDLRHRRLTLFNDRFGLQALFYVQVGRQFLFASSTWPLLAHPGVEPRLDRVAVAEFLTFEFVLGERTLLEGISLLPPATCFVVQDGRVREGRYWHFHFARRHRLHENGYYVEAWTERMERAVARQLRDDGPIGVQLSGGLDSRVVLAFIRSRHPSVHTFTFGLPDSDDARLAREVARQLHTVHHFLPLRPDFVQEIAEEAVRLSDGLKSCVHLHAFAQARQMAEHVRAVYTGSLGDSLMGGHLSRSLWACYDEEELARSLFRQYNVVFSPPALSALLGEGFEDGLREQVFADFRATLAESRARLQADVREHFSIRQSDRRWILEGQRLLRHYLIVRTPFYDNDLVDFMLTVPPGLRFEEYLYRIAFRRAFPRLAKVPLEKTGLPLAPGMRDLRIRLGRRVRWWLRSAGLRFVAPPRRRPYADYNGWLRTALRPWVEETLLGPQTRLQDLFRPQPIRELVAEQMAGADHARRLGVLLTLELWLRQLS